MDVKFAGVILAWISRASRTLSGEKATLGLAIACLLSVGLAASPALPSAPDLQVRLLSYRPETLVEARALPAVIRFYQERAFQPLWLDEAGPTRAAQAVGTILAASQADGLEPESYGAARITTLLAAPVPEVRADLELALTLGVLGYAHDLYSGRIEPSRIDPELFLEPEEPGFDRILAGAAEAGDIAAFLKAFQPPRPEYRRLREALSRYRHIADEGGWPALPSGPTVKPGMTDPRVPELARRLRLSGDLPASAAMPAETLRYGGELEAAVRRFQARHGLAVDGILAAETLAALNVPVTERIRQIVINLERRRWMPRDLGVRYLFVNLADFTVRAVDGDTTLAKAKLVVGAPYSRTPVFAASMTYIEINPFWNVPHSIATREILPKLRRDPGYLARNHYTLLSGWSPGAVPVNAADVDWKRVSAAAFPYRIRQEPGDDNALGRIKFMFPNRFNVYLHDTPAKALFARTVRTFSHGCMRMENALAMAPLIFSLAGNPEWTAERVAAAVAAGRREVVTLRIPIPVYVSYATVFVAGDGEVNFRRDVYGRDARLAAALSNLPRHPMTVSIR